MGDTGHFDAHATSYDDPDKARRAHDVARAVVAAGAARPGPTGTVRLLEYGAGTGLVTQALSALVDDLSATLADASSGMRGVMQDKVASGALPVDARIVHLDLEQEPAPAERFDLVVSSLVLHHVRDLDRVLAGLAELLDEGGHLCVADLDREDGSFHATVHGFSGHDGFDREELAQRMRSAGFAEVSVADCTSLDKDGRTYSVFLATGRRPGRTPTDLKGWLHHYLRAAQESLLWKLEGLSEYDVRRPLTPTGTNLLGLVKHLAGVELGYLGDTFGRPSGIPLPWYDDGAEDNADMWATPQESREEILDLYRRAWAHGDATVEALDLDAPGRVAHWPDDRADVTLGQILVHLTTETYRHAGHADILRELLDGRVGLREGRTNLPDLGEEDWAAHHERLEEAAREADRGEG